MTSKTLICLWSVPAFFISHFYYCATPYASCLLQPTLKGAKPVFFQFAGSLTSSASLSASPSHLSHHYFTVNLYRTLNHLQHRWCASMVALITWKWNTVFFPFLIQNDALLNGSNCAPLSKFSPFPQTSPLASVVIKHAHIVQEQQLHTPQQTLCDLKLHICEYLEESVLYRRISIVELPVLCQHQLCSLMEWAFMNEDVFVGLLIKKFASSMISIRLLSTDPFSTVRSKYDIPKCFPVPVSSLHLFRKGSDCSFVTEPHAKLT